MYVPPHNLNCPPASSQSRLVLNLGSLTEIVQARYRGAYMYDQRPSFPSIEGAHCVRRAVGAHVPPAFARRLLAHARPPHTGTLPDNRAFELHLRLFPSFTVHVARNIPERRYLLPPQQSERKDQRADGYTHLKNLVPKTTASEVMHLAFLDEPCTCPPHPYPVHSSRSDLPFPPRCGGLCINSAGCRVSGKLGGRAWHI